MASVFYLLAWAAGIFAAGACFGVAMQFMLGCGT